MRTQQPGPAPVACLLAIALLLDGVPVARAATETPPAPEGSSVPAYKLMAPQRRAESLSPEERSRFNELVRQQLHERKSQARERQSEHAEAALTAKSAGADARKPGTNSGEFASPQRSLDLSPPAPGDESRGANSAQPDASPRSLIWQGDNPVRANQHPGSDAASAPSQAKLSGKKNGLQWLLCGVLVSATLLVGLMGALLLRAGHAKKK